MNLENTTTSQWNKWLVEQGHIRVVAVEATRLMNGLSLQQGLGGVAQQGYAEAVVGSLLIASAHKSNESINLNAQGSGVFKQALVDASPEGRVRGFLIEEKDPSLHTYGEKGFNGPWGSGVLSILYTKNFEGKTPYTGMVPISTGFLDEAINEYYRDSEQLVSTVGLHIEIRNGDIVAARGALVQALGGASNEELEVIQSLSIKDMRGLAALAHHSDAFQARATEMLSASDLGGNPRELRNVEQKALESFCNCSQERIERAFLLTGEDDIMEALAGDDFLSVTCDFCRKEYRLSRERLIDLFSRDPSPLQ